jgi:hypothetical protein
MKRTVLIALCVLLIGGMGFSQERTGNIYGTVVDEGKTALPGILVTLSGDLIGKMTTITNSNGNFKFLSLSPGKYDLKAELEGYATLVRKDVRVEVGANLKFTMTLVPKKIQEEVVVSAAPVAIDAKKTTYATNLSKEELQTLPTARDPFVILELTPGLAMDRQNVGGSESGQQSNFVSRGSVRGSSNWSTDGINITDQIATGAAPQYYDFDAFEEIQIQTAATDITSMTAGAQINMITKRGGNKFSGGGRFYFTDDSFQGENTPSDFNPDYTPTKIDAIKDMGLNIGGPIFKDKLWFWMGGSIQDISKLAPTGDLQKQKLKNFEFKANMTLGKHRFEGFFNWSDKTVNGRVSSSVLDAWESHYNQSSPHPFFKIQDEFTVSDNLFLSAKFGYFEGGFLLTPIGPVDGIAYYDQATGTYSGTYRESDYIRHQHFYQLTGVAFADNLLGASHEIKFGAEYKLFPGKRKRNYESQRLRYYDLEAGRSRRAYIYRDSDYSYNLDRLSFFAQDSISFKRLTIIAGLRYDIQTGKVNELDVAGTSVDWAEELGMNLPAVHVDAQKLNFDWKNLSPRLGIIYDFSGEGKTLAKFNFGMYGTHIDPDFPYSLASTYAYRYWNWTDANGDKLVQVDELRGNPRTYDYFNQLDPSELYDANLKTPLTMEFTLGVEHELIKDFGLGLNLIYRKNYRDYEGYYKVDDNGTLRLPTPDDWVIGGYIPAEHGGTAWWEYSIWYTQRPDFYTRYLGLEITFKKRLSAASRWMINGSFTYQKWTRHYPSVWSYGNNYDPTDHLPVELLDGRPSGYISGSSGASEASINPRWMAKLGFVVQLPYKINFGGTLSAREGYILPEYYQDTTVERNGLDDNPDPYTGPYGSKRLDDFVMLNLRLERAFQVSFTRLIFSVDLFNVFNTNTVLDREYNVTRNNYNTIVQFTYPRIFRLGVRLDF